MTEQTIAGPFNTFPDNTDAIRAQIETLNAITAYYASITAIPAVRPEPVITAKDIANVGGAVADALHKMNRSGAQVIQGEKFARGGVVYPTKVETITAANGPVAAITFAWSPDEAHHLGRNEVLELRDQLSRFLLESAKQLSPEVKS
ncbi:hypothetical protein R4P64_07875 [Rhodococcus sp. IEGM 1366]|uniref:hypothetical protein n=1 Tax=Rhodococcus sp. IEGM 1366 TaxID=3082223 RepID=UPI002955A1DB|nr:hypothetical protein [Rhodococcus sp. IEGM 1366]MDV8066419.1 hypothetical protein [Rhodococcus sp. IEGM 1366]